MLCLPAKATLLRPSEVEGFKDFFGDGVVRDLGEWFRVWGFRV
jgi:hypothetical protein